jgi:hypothetical protein
MFKLSQELKFQTEFKKYTSVIEKIKNTEVQQHGYALLNELIHQCNLIDAVHNPVTNKNIDPTKVRENVEKVINIRMTLDGLVKDSK